MFFKIVKQICPGGGMVDTLVLEANVERRASSSLAWGTIKNNIGRYRLWTHRLMKNRAILLF